LKIFLLFRKIRPAEISLRHKPSKRFLFYTLTGWGIPAVITGTALGIDLSGLTSYDILKPNFGIGSCWFNGILYRCLIVFSNNPSKSELFPV
jgi:hypothetical protein